MARILLVEDSSTIVSSIESKLRAAGHQVYVARDGLTALASVRAFLPHLVLLDTLLPHVNGFDICKSVRGNHDYDGVPIIMISGLTDDENVQHAYDLGANGYIKKPVCEEELFYTIDDHLNQHPEEHHVM